MRARLKLCPSAVDDDVFIRKFAKCGSPERRRWDRAAPAPGLGSWRGEHSRSRGREDQAVCGGAAEYCGRGPGVWRSVGTGGLGPDGGACVSRGREAANSRARWLCVREAGSLEVCWNRGLGPDGGACVSRGREAANSRARWLRVREAGSAGPIVAEPERPKTGAIKD